MAQSQFKPGDTVQLKSGGPLVTVESVSQYEGKVSVRCTWFVDNKLQNALFVPEVLEIDE